MSTKQNYGENMLKGRMAETLVDEMLRKSGNTVYRFGYEAIMQNLTQIKRGFDSHSEVGERIRAIPDFVVIDKTGNPIFLEVKFRRDGKLHRDDVARLKRIKDFWNAKMIFVNCSEKPFFRVADPPYINEKSELVSTPMLAEKAWKINPVTYQEYEVLVEKYLAPMLIKPVSKKFASVKS